MIDTLQNVGLVLLGIVALYHAWSIKRLGTIRAVLVESKDKEYARLLDDNRVLRAQLERYQERKP